MLEKHVAICPSALQSFPFSNCIWISMSLQYVFIWLSWFYVQVSLQRMHRCKSVFLFWYWNMFDFVNFILSTVSICRSLVSPVSHLARVNVTICTVGYNTWAIQPLWITIISSYTWLCDTTGLNLHGTGDYIEVILWPFSICTICLIWKGFNPCEKLPLCLIFLCCLNQGKLGHRKIWMKQRQRADSVAKKFLWRVDS